jgi:hypothetical protein
MRILTIVSKIYSLTLVSCATGTAVWQNGGFSAKFKFSSSIELLYKTEHLCFDFRHFAKLQNVISYGKKTPTPHKVGAQ